jgi:hypothetical protein
MCPQWDTSQKENETTHGLAPFANSARAKSNEHAILLRKYLQLRRPMAGRSRIWWRCCASNCLSTRPAPISWLTITFHPADSRAWCLGRPDRKGTVRAREFVMHAASGPTLAPSPTCSSKTPSRCADGKSLLDRHRCTASRRCEEQTTKTELAAGVSPPCSFAEGYIFY